MSIDVSLRWHLSYNHYPPVSIAFIPTAKRAIELANEGEWDTEIEMPNGITLEVGAIIEGLHLDFYLDDDEEEDDEEEDDEEPPEASLTTGWVDGRASYE
jgi:hypothetical protein